MQTYLNVAQLVLSVALILAIILQLQGAGIGSIFGQSRTVYRTKRGVERTLFLFTIVLVVLFLAISILSLRFAS